MSCCENEHEIDQAEDITEIYYIIERALDWIITAQSTVADYDEPTCADLDKAGTAIDFGISDLEKVKKLMRIARKKRLNFEVEEEEDTKTLDPAITYDYAPNILGAVSDRQIIERIVAVAKSDMNYTDRISAVKEMVSKTPTPYPDPKDWSVYANE
jgi:hypothetical protein